MTIGQKCDQDLTDYRFLADYRLADTRFEAKDRFTHGSESPDRFNPGYRAEYRLSSRKLMHAARFVKDSATAKKSAKCSGKVVACFWQI
jgi:hypothetical protein